MIRISCFFILLGLSQLLPGQIAMTWNTYIDLELSRAGSKSHYFYNEIHRNHHDWRFDLTRADLMTTLRFGDRWHMTAHAMVEREMGRRAGLLKKLSDYTVLLPQLHLAYTFEKWPLRITAGRLIDPFGAFYRRQLYWDRPLISTPLAYSYYTDVSPRFGLVDGLAEDVVLLVDSVFQWGTPLLYRLGYKNGLMATLGESEKLNWSVALVDGAANRRSRFPEPWQWGVSSRLGFSPVYFANFEISFSHGQFQEAGTANAGLSGAADRFRQTLLGFDYKLGFSYFEFSGELIGSWHQVPIYDSEDEIFVEPEANLTSFSGYLDARFEPPFLSGAFLAYRFDLLTFGEYPDGQGERLNWDDEVTRHVFAAGYKLQAYALIKAAWSTQRVANRDWRRHQRTLRIMLTLHW